MERTINIQKVDGNGNGRKNCMVDVHLRFENGNFGASASVWNARHTDIIQGGHCFDDLIENYPELTKNEVFMEILDLWDHWHLNDMHAGTPEQEQAIAEWKAQGNQYDYGKACDYLKSINLYEVPVSSIDKTVNPLFENYKEDTYKYGHEWLKEPISERDAQRIESLINYGQVLEMNNELDREDTEPEL